MSEFMTQAIIYMPYEMAMSDEISRRQLYARAQEILSERDQLRAEVERLRKDSDRLDWMIDEEAAIYEHNKLIGGRGYYVVWHRH